MFVQIMNLKTTRFDELEALEDEWRTATEGQRTLRREIVARDRNDPTRYTLLAFFDSYEDAMKNSQLPATDAIAGKMAALCEEGPTFLDLDVIRER
jgi:hypothetical protein